MSPQKKLILAAACILVVASTIIAVVYYVRSSEDIDILPGADAAAITLMCSNGYSAKATYYDGDSSGVMRRLLLVTAKGEDIKQYLMRQDVSASGAKFTTRDKITSLWEHQEEFTFEENGTALAVCKDASKVTFVLDGNPVTLTNGLSEEEVAPGSITKNVVKYFGNEAAGDINGDGTEDKVFYITKETGGSGTFFYVVGMLGTNILPKGTQAALVGDRIAPQNLEIRDGVVLVNYADRKPGEPFTAQPSVGKTLRLKLDPTELDFGEVAVNFEGEADPNAMTLSMKEWKWIKTLYSDDKEVLPKQKDAFAAVFTKEGEVSLTTDCNTMNAQYTSTGTLISFGSIMSTKMFCEDSQELEFGAMLGEVDSYLFTGRGELILLFKKDSGSMVFK